MLFTDQKPAHIRTSEHYRQYRQQLAMKGATKKSHAISTKNNIKGIKLRWKKYNVSMADTLWTRVLMTCRLSELMDEDPLSFLQRCTKEDIMTFLKWILDEYRVRKKSTLHEYWRVWRMLYRRCVGHSLHAKIAGDINNVSSLSSFLWRGGFSPNGRTVHRFGPHPIAQLGSLNERKTGDECRRRILSPSSSLGHGHGSFPGWATKATGSFPRSDHRIHRESTRSVGIRGAQ